MNADQNNGELGEVHGRTWTDYAAHVLGNVKKGFHGVLFLISKKSSSSMGTAIVLSLIDTMQMVAFALPLRKLDNDEAPIILRVCSKAASMTSFGMLTIQALGLQLAAVTVLLLMSFQLANLIYVGNAWVKKRFSSILAVKALRLTTSAMVGVVYIPMLTVLLSFLKSCNFSFRTSTECAVMVFPSFLTAIFFVCFSLIVCLSFFNSDPRSSAPMSRPHSRITFMHLTAKTLLVVNMTVTNLVDSNQFLWSWLVLVVATGLSALYIIYQPFYSQKMCTLKAVTATAFAWFAVCQLVNYIFPGETTISLLTAAGLAFLLPLSYVAVQFRRRQLARKPWASVGGPFEAEMKARFALQGIGESYVDLPVCLPEEIADRIKSIKSVYETLVDEFETSATMAVFQAEFILAFETTHRTLLARKAILQATSRGPPLDFEFIILKKKRVIQELTQATKTDVIKYVMSEKYMRDAIEQDKKCCTLLLSMWNELLCEMPNMEKVRLLTTAFGKHSTSAVANYQKLVKVSPRSAEAYRYFGTFVVDVVNDRERGEPLLAKALRLQEAQEDKGRSHGEDNLLMSMNFGKNSTAVIIARMQGERNDIGEIISINEKAGDLMNGASHTIIGRNITSLLLPPISVKLQDEIIRYLNSGDSCLMNQNIATFCKTIQGSLTPITLRFNPFTKNGMDFSLYVCIMPRTCTTDPYLVFDSKLAVLGWSQSLRHFLDRLVLRENVEEIPLSSTTTLTELLQGFNLKNPAVFLEEGALISLRAHRVENGKRTTVLLETRALVTTLNVGSQESLENMQYLLAFQDAKHFMDGHESDLESSSVDLSDPEDDVGSVFESASVREDKVADMTKLNLGREPQATGVSVRGVSVGNASVKSSATKRDRKAVGPGSQASATSRHTTKSATAALRELVKSKSKKGMSANLKRMWLMYFSAVLITITVFVTKRIFEAQSTQVFEQNVRLVNTAGYRRFCVVSLARDAHSLLIMSRSNVTSSYSKVPTSIVIDRMNFAVLELRAAEKELYNMRSTFPTKLQEYYTVPRIQTKRKEGSLVQTFNSTLFDTSMLFSSVASKLTASDLSILNIDSPNLYFLLYNADHSSPYYTALHESTEQFAALTNYFVGVMETQAVVFILFALGIALLLLTISLWPLYRAIKEIDKSKSEVLEIFLSIDKKTVKSITMTFVNRLKEYHSQDWDQAEFEQAELEEKIQSAPSQSGEKVKNTSRKGTWLRSGAVKDKLEENVSKGSNSNNKVHPAGGEKTAKTSKSAKGKPKSSLTSGKRRLASFGLRVASILFVSIGYIASSSMIRQNRLANVLQNAAHEASLGSLRRILVRQSLHELKLLVDEAVRGAVFEESFTEQKETLRHTLNSLEAAHTSLLYGEDSSGLLGLLRWPASQQDADLMTLMFEDGCSGWNEGNVFNLTKENCGTLNAGIMKGGLNAALLDFIFRMRQLLEVSSNLEEIQRNGVQFFSDPRFQDIQSAESMYIQAQLETAVQIRRSTFTARFTSDRNTQNAMLGLFVLVILVLLLFFVNPLIMELDLEVKNSIALLVNIPQELIESLPVARSYLKKVVKSLQE